ncbi:MAG: glycosyltransferase family 39 protein, partial [Planctomycetes bacterium]|nr:glycosyltransferase family 39 protein [Planctomycetota bacterium]
MSSVSTTLNSRPDLTPEPIRRHEWILAFMLFALGLGLRAAWPDRLGVEHFDEGVYASNFYYTGEKGDEHYPNQHLYAPPLLPTLIEYLMVLVGPGNVAAVAIGITAGSLTILLVWWSVRQWIGPAAGLVASTLVALSDIHIAFSRTALTDVLLCLFLVAAVHGFWSAHTRSSWWRAVLAGGWTGLAWWTKYNGWLPAAIGLSGVLAWRLFEIWNQPRSPATDPNRLRRAIRPIALSLLLWGTMVFVAALVWAPFWWSLQHRGGYAAVAANHRTYLVGFAGWSTSLVTQARKLSIFSGPLTGCSSLVALAVALLWQRFRTPRFTWNALLRSNSLYLAVPVLGLLCVTEGGAVMLSFLGVVGALVGVAVAVAVPPDTPTVPPSRRLAAWLLLAWVFGLFLSVPLYTPYPRLLLPLLIATWIGVGIFAEILIAEIQQAIENPNPVQEVVPKLGRRFRSRQMLARARPLLLLVLLIGTGIAITQH